MKEEALLFTPSYFSKFHCLMGVCPDSCCKAGWEIPVDDETVEKLRALTALEIDKNIRIGSDGDIVIRTNSDGTCPYLTPDGLCKMYLESGLMGDVCMKHPRFYEEYYIGESLVFTEAGLSVSCPETARIVLSASESDYSSLFHEETGDELLDFLLKARAKAFELSPSQLISYGGLLQEEIDFGTLEIPDCDIPETKPTDVRDLCEFILRETEILTPEWRDFLENCEKESRMQESRPLLDYLIFRFFLKAFNSEDILTECKLIVALYELCSLGDNFTETVRLVSKELEHDDFNLDLLRDFLADS